MNRASRVTGEERAARTERVRAIVYRPESDAFRMESVVLPGREADQVHVRTLVAGVDGTDVELVEEGRAEPPEGSEYLVLGHEALGEVVDAPEGAGLEPGDRVVPMVRPGCGHCAHCRGIAPDMCPTDAYREHGIKGLHGFMRDEWSVNPRELVKVPRELGTLAVLTEPLSIVVKALETARAVQRRIPWFEDEGGFRGQRALLAGTGSLGMLGAFLLRHEGMEVWAMDRSPDDAPPARLLRDIGAHHVNARERDVKDVARDVDGFDLVIEATGVPQVAFDVLHTVNKNGACAMLGVPGETSPFRVDGGALMGGMVLGNQVLFGSVNSNRTHFEEALRRLAAFRARWGDEVERVVTHTFPIDQYHEAFKKDDPSVIKKVIQWAS